MDSLSEILNIVVMKSKNDMHGDISLLGLLKWTWNIFTISNQLHSFFSDTRAPASAPRTGSFLELKPKLQRGTISFPNSETQDSG